MNLMYNQKCCSCGASSTDLKIETETIECSEHPLFITQNVVTVTCTKCLKKESNYPGCKGCSRCSDNGSDNVHLNCGRELRFEKVNLPVSYNIPIYSRKEIEFNKKMFEIPKISFRPMNLEQKPKISFRPMNLEQKPKISFRPMNLEQNSKISFRPMNLEWGC
jgi:hypothetical protein